MKYHVRFPVEVIREGGHEMPFVHMIEMDVIADDPTCAASRVQCLFNWIIDRKYVKAQ